MVAVALYHLFLGCCHGKVIKVFQCHPLVLVICQIFSCQSASYWLDMPFLMAKGVGDLWEGLVRPVGLDLIFAFKELLGRGLRHDLTILISKEI